jgi:hypothetical protein
MRYLISQLSVFYLLFYIVYSYRLSQIRGKRDHVIPSVNPSLLSRATQLNKANIHSFSLSSSVDDINNEERERNLIKKQVNLLVDIWRSVSINNNAAVGEDQTYSFRLEDYGLDRKNVKGLLKHFQTCKDCAGDGAFLQATQDNNLNDILRLSNIYFPLVTDEDDDGETFGEFDLTFLDQYNDDESVRDVFPIESDDAVILRDTREW